MANTITDFLMRERDLAVQNPPDTSGDPNWLDVSQRMQAGDAAALAIFYQELFDLMFHEVQRVAGRDEATSLDIVQEAMLKAIRCIKPLPDFRSVKAWSRAVAKSAAYDWLRKQARHNPSQLGDADQISHPHPADYVDIDLARMAWLEEQLMSLPRELQNVISLRYRLGWSLKEIGEKLGLKTGAVDGRIRRAIETLKQEAKREFDE